MGHTGIIIQIYSDKLTKSNKTVTTDKQDNIEYKSQRLRGITIPL